MDEPAAAAAVCDAYWQKLRPVLERVAAHPAVASAILMDNVDTPFYPPNMLSDYWAPYVKDAAAIMRSHGKHLFVHACGKLAALSPAFAACGLSGLEGIAHPPLGDWTVDGARACHPDFIFVGGFSAREQELMTDDEVRSFYADYLPVADQRRLIFSASCQTSIRTSWARIKLVQAICHAWGGAAPVTTPSSAHVRQDCGHG